MIEELTAKNNSDQGYVAESQTGLYIRVASDEDVPIECIREVLDKVSEEALSICSSSSFWIKNEGNYTLSPYEFCVQDYCIEDSAEGDSLVAIWIHREGATSPEDILSMQEAVKRAVESVALATKVNISFYGYKEYQRRIISCTSDFVLSAPGAAVT